MLARLAGGLVELAQHEPEEVTRQRLLSPEALKKRIARFDNVKSLRLSWATLESLITAHEISGKRLYHGEAVRPNNLTWILTLNGPSLSTDMAQRSVMIHLAKPAFEGNWEEETVRWIDTHRDAIVGDCLGFLSGPKRAILDHSRWAAWEDGVLSHVADPTAVVALIRDRAAAADTEREEIELIEEGFGEKLADLHYDTAADKVHIPVKIVYQWYGEITGERSTSQKASKIIGQFIDEGRTVFLKRNASQKYGRGLLWVGSSANVDDYAHYDLTDRIAMTRTEKRVFGQGFGQGSHDAEGEF